MALVFTTTRTIPVTHVHLARTRTKNDLEAFVSSPGVSLSITSHLGKDAITGETKPGVLDSGDYERLAQYNYSGIQWEQLVDEVSTLLQERKIPLKLSERKTVFSEYLGASGDYQHLIFDESIGADTLTKFFETLYDKYPKAY